MSGVPLILLLALVALMQSAAIVPSYAEENDAGSAPALAPVCLKICSGYEDQDIDAFQLLAEFTIEDLEQMELMEQDYTLRDQEEGVIVCHALGVRLQEILERSEINLEEIEALRFLTADGSSVEMDTEMLLQEQR